MPDGKLICNADESARKELTEDFPPAAELCLDIVPLFKITSLINQVSFNIHLKSGFFNRVTPVFGGFPHFAQQKPRGLRQKQCQLKSFDASPDRAALQALPPGVPVLPDR